MWMGFPSNIRTYEALHAVSIFRPRPAFLLRSGEASVVFVLHSARGCRDHWLLAATAPAFWLIMGKFRKMVTWRCAPCSLAMLLCAPQDNSML